MMEKQMKDYRGMIKLDGDLYQFSKSRLELHSLDGKVTLHLEDMEVRSVSIKDRKINDGKPYIEVFHGRYDSKYKELKYDSVELTEYDKEWWTLIQIPRAVVEHGRGLSDEQMAALNQQSLKEDMGYFLIDSEISARMNGKLPTIIFDGIVYQVDLGLQEIRQLEHLEKKFLLNDIAGPVILFYNPVLKEPIEVDHRITEMPKDLACLKIEQVLLFDPIFLELFFERDITKAGFYPVYATGEDIRVIPLEQTNLAEMVRRNQIEQETQGQGAQRATTAEVRSGDAPAHSRKVPRAKLKRGL